VSGGDARVEVTADAARHSEIELWLNGGKLDATLASKGDRLARAGSDKSKLLMCLIFITDLADFPALNAVWEAWLPAGHAPSRATVVAQLAEPEWRVEMVVTAAL